MSRRSRRAGAGAQRARAQRAGAQRAGAPPRAAEPAATAPTSGAPGRAPYRIRPRYQVAILIALFAVVTLVAELAGAASLGVALGIGQIVFGFALVVVLLRS